MLKFFRHGSAHSSKSRKLKVIAIVLVVFLVVLGIPGFKLYADAKKTIAAGQLLSADIKTQNLDSAKVHLRQVKGSLQDMKTTLNIFRPISFIPLIGWYYSDLDHGVNAGIAMVESGEIINDALVPYADILGLKGTGTFLGGNAQDRMQKAIQTLEKVTPKLDDVGSRLKIARSEINKISSWRYPNILPGSPGKRIDQAHQVIDQTETLVVDAKPVLESLPLIMGQPTPKTYLVLFQNDGELRPSGGFITAYAYFTFDKGKIIPGGSSDIYELDATLGRTKSMPPALSKYLPLINRYNLRDSNISPDFKVAMQEFESLYQNTASRKDIDGIFAMDTKFLVSLIRVLGPVTVGGMTYKADNIDICGCPQVIYELEYFAGRPSNVIRSGRKDIIGVLMQGILDKVLTAKKDKWPDLIQTSLDMLNQKHTLLYFHDPKAQAAVEQVNFAGVIKEYDGDYFHLNDANFAGAKVNLYLEQTVSQKVDISSDGTITKTVTITYKNPRRGDNCELERTEGVCLSGTYRDWLRIYVPKGSKLLEATGSINDPVTSEDLGKTVFEGFIAISPQASTKVTYKYTLPFKYDKNKPYKLLIQKQPGTGNSRLKGDKDKQVGDREYNLDIKGKKQKFILDVDKEIEVKL